jgi:hypothetical protein
MLNDISKNSKATIGVEKTVYDVIIPFIDNSKYLNLHNVETSRSALFDFAIALGIKDKKTKLKNIVSLWRWEHMSDEQLSIYDSFWFSEDSNSNNLQDVLKGANVITIAEEYANTGFQKLEKLMKNVDDENFAMSLILEMNQINEAIDSQTFL